MPSRVSPVMPAHRIELGLFIACLAVACGGGRSTPDPTPTSANPASTPADPTAHSSPPADSASPVAGVCEIDPSSAIDCVAACEHYAAGYARSRREGEVPSPAQCPRLCESLASPPPSRDVAIYWHCMERHDVCSRGAHECQSTCLTSAGLPPPLAFAEPCTLGSPGS